MHTKFWSKNLEERKHLEDLDVDGMLILEWISEKEAGKFWIGFMWLRIGNRGGIV
jgi:hypothetical protein